MAVWVRSVAQCGYGVRGNVWGWWGWHKHTKLMVENTYEFRFNLGHKRCFKMQQPKLRD